VKAEVWTINADTIPADKSVTAPQNFSTWLKEIDQGTDPLFKINYQLPFLMVHHWQILLLLLSNLQRLKGWVEIDFHIGKLVEISGD
jgi:hypothetical protein